VQLKDTSQQGEEWLDMETEDAAPMEAKEAMWHICSRQDM
jgi:hypothetical protein